MRGARARPSCSPPRILPMRCSRCAHCPTCGSPSRSIVEAAMRPLAWLCFLLLAASCASTRSLPPGERLVLVTVAESGASRMPARGYHQPGYQISETATTTLADLERDYALTRIDGWPIEPLDVYCAVMQVRTRAQVDDTLARIAHDPRVRLAQPMQTFAVHGASYNDPYFSLQYGANSLELLQMHQRATGDGIHIALIDTGVDRSHPDLAGRIGVSRNFVDGDARF